ncbi:MAG: Holliday junction resolvase RuvX [Bacteroidota bacterium]
MIPLWYISWQRDFFYICPMSRIMAIDYGTKRVGVAVTDPLKIVANGLDTVSNDEIMAFLEQYLAEESVETIVVGEPMHLDGRPAQIAVEVNDFVQRLKKKFPTIKIDRFDERFTSQDAKQIILRSGAKQKKRRDKSLIDKVSAVLILQGYMEENCY